MSDELKRYTVDLVSGTRGAAGVQLGASPRASIALMKAAQALALFDGMEFVTPDQIQELAIPVIAHRLVMEPQARFAGQPLAAWWRRWSRGFECRPKPPGLGCPGLRGVQPPMTPILLLLYRLYRLVSGVWLWARRRFTPAGLSVLAATILAMGLGVDTDNNVVYQAFTLLLSLLLVAVLFAGPFRPRLSATRLLPRFGTAGSPIRYQVRVQNLGAERQTGLTLLDNLADSRPTFREWKAAQMDEERQARSFRVSQQRRMNPFKTASVKNAPLGPVAPHQEVEVDLEVIPLKRGVLRFTGITFARPDPLGLFRALARRPLPQTILILPRRYAVPPIALPGAMNYPGGRGSHGLERRPERGLRISARLPAR